MLHSLSPLSFSGSGRSSGELSFAKGSLFVSNAFWFCKNRTGGEGSSRVLETLEWVKVTIP